MQRYAFWPPRGPLVRSKGTPQALRRPISCENTKSSVLHKETYISRRPYTPCCTSFHHLVEQKFIANRLRDYLFGFGCPLVPSSKPQHGLYQKHNSGPWLIHCDQTCQTSLDFSRSLVFNIVQRVSMSIFWSPERLVGIS